MRILFTCNTIGNYGSTNANRELINNWPKEDKVMELYSVSKQAMFFEGVCKGLSCDAVVSPGTSLAEIALHAVLARFGKPVVCFNHGYVPFENEVNRLGYSKRKVAAIEWHMRTADAIVANSELQMHFIQSRLEGFSGRYAFTNLGIDPFEQAETARSNPHPVIATSGGTRPVKANEVVVRAARILRSRGIDCELRIYGDDYAANEELSAAFVSGEATLMGQVPQDDFIRQLGEADIFVMNSRHESFGLSALDAIKAGCSLLISRNCGVSCVFALEDGDVVKDCEDAAEVADKIEGLLAHPNVERLYHDLDFDTLSWKRTAQRLRDVVALCCDESR